MPGVQAASLGSPGAEAGAAMIRTLRAIIAAALDARDEARAYPNGREREPGDWRNYGPVRLCKACDIILYTCYAVAAATVAVAIIAAICG